MSILKISIVVIIAVIAAIAWLRTIWAREKNRNASKKIVEDLRSGKHNVESYAAALDMMICSRPLPEETGEAAARHYFQSLSGQKILSKFNIAYGELNENRNGIVVAEGTVRGSLNAPGTDTDVDLTYPCWLYISWDEEDEKILFRSTFPENEDHRQLLEDLSGELYRQAWKK